MSPIDLQRPTGEREQLSHQEQARLWALLDTLTDPEIPVVTLREMGILRALRRGGGGAGEGGITPPYSGRPATGQMAPASGRVVTQLAPAWTTDWMSEAARDKLRAYGIAPPRCASRRGGESVIHFAPKSRAAGARLAGADGPSDAEDAVACPQCGSTHTTETSHFGSTACKALYRCLDCLEPFDHFKSI